MPRPSVNMTDVARAAGVSVGTVSNVLNSPDIVSAATRTRVLNVIEDLGWVRNESARQLRAGRSRSVGMVVMDISNPFFTDVLAGVEGYVTDRSHSVHLGNSAQSTARETTHLQLFEQQRVRGVLLAPALILNAYVDKLRDRGTPVVIVDRDVSDGTFCSVSVDDVAGGTLAMNHLLDRGHQQLAFVGGPDSIPQVKDRRAGALAALTTAGHQARSLRTLSMPRMDLTNGVVAATQLASLPAQERPTGVFAANDLLAIGLLQGFMSHGLSVPQDIALVGYDDIAFAAAAAVPLTSIRQPRAEIGQQAASLLFEEIAASDEGTPHTHQQVRFAPILVARRSSLG